MQGLTSENEKLTLTHFLQKFAFFKKKVSVQKWNNPEFIATQVITNLLMNFGLCKESSEGVFLLLRAHNIGNLDDSGGRSPGASVA